MLFKYYNVLNVMPQKKLWINTIIYRDYPKQYNLIISAKNQVILYVFFNSKLTKHYGELGDYTYYDDTKNDLLQKIY